MRKFWGLGALALVLAGCGGDGNDDNNNGGGSVIPAATVAALTSDRRIVVFNTNSPDVIQTRYTISGLPSDDDAVSIDYRPADPDRLYLVTEDGRLYTVASPGNNDTLEATLVGRIDTDGEDVEEVDFNPVADRLRVATDNNGSLRVNPSDAATIVDGSFDYADTSLNTDVEGVAYTNSIGTATSTTLYAIDTAQNALVRVDPPNAGTLTTVGSLGFNVEGPVPFDISPEIETVGFIAQNSGDRSRLYSVDTQDGSTIRGRLTPSGVRVIGLTVLPRS